MKKYLLILLSVLLCAGCGTKKHTLKVDDPVQRAAMRTRDASCPIDSIFTSNGVSTTFDIVRQIKPKALLKDFSEAQADTTSVKPMARMKNSWSAVKTASSGKYNPGLTVYSAIMVLVFLFLALFKSIRAIFKKV